MIGPCAVVVIQQNMGDVMVGRNALNFSGTHERTPPQTTHAYMAYQCEMKSKATKAAAIGIPFCSSNSWPTTMSSKLVQNRSVTMSRTAPKLDAACPNNQICGIDGKQR